MKFLIINGPNLNMLGIREPGIYGNSTYKDLCALIEEHAGEIGVEVMFYQSNHEGDLVDAIQKYRQHAFLEQRTPHIISGFHQKFLVQFGDAGIQFHHHTFLFQDLCTQFPDPVCKKHCADHHQYHGKRIAQ